MGILQKPTILKKISDIESSLGEIVTNVKKFGAKGDGTTDDTTAIQNAINATLSISGGRLLFPNGTYKITSAITIPFSTGFIIEGQSRSGTVIKQYTDNTPIFRFTTAMTHSWEIKNIDFEYANVQVVTNVLSVPIYFALDSGLGGAGYYNFKIDSCTFNSGYYAISQKTDSQNIALWGANISNCVFGGTLSGGAIYLVPSPSVGQPEISIENCYINCGDMTKSALAISYCDSVLLKSVEFNSGSYSTVNQILISTCSSVTLINCRSEAVAVSGTNKLWNFPQSNVTIIGCAISSLVTSESAVCSLIAAGTGGTITVHGLIGSGTLGSGSAVYATDGDNIILLENCIVYNGFGRYPYWISPHTDLDNVQFNLTQSRGDSDITLTSSDRIIQYFNSAFTANRVITLPSSGLYDGLTFTIAKYATDSYTLQITDPISAKNTTFTAGQKFSITYRAIGTGEWVIVQKSIL